MTCKDPASKPDFLFSTITNQHLTAVRLTEKKMRIKK
jgi:hypothetical protein